MSTLGPSLIWGDFGREVTQRVAPAATLARVTLMVSLAAAFVAVAVEIGRSGRVGRFRSAFVPLLAPVAVASALLAAQPRLLTVDEQLGTCIPVAGRDMCLPAESAWLSENYRRGLDAAFEWGPGAVTALDNDSPIVYTAMWQKPSLVEAQVMQQAAMTISGVDKCDLFGNSETTTVAYTLARELQDRLGVAPIESFYENPKLADWLAALSDDELRRTLTQVEDALATCAVSTSQLSQAITSVQTTSNP